jgi:hypothetical protein
MSAVCFAVYSSSARLRIRGHTFFSFFYIYNINHVPFFNFFSVMYICTVNPRLLHPVAISKFSVTATWASIQKSAIIVLLTAPWGCIREPTNLPMGLYLKKNHNTVVMQYGAHCAFFKNTAVL